MININKLNVEIIPLSDLIGKNGKFKLDESAEQFGRSMKMQYDQLKSSIADIGQTDPIIIWRNQVCDGRHRCVALHELEIDTVKVRSLPHKTGLEERMKLAKDTEFTRRHETPTQLACTAAKEYYRRKALGQKVTARIILDAYPTTDSLLTPAKKLYEYYPAVFETLFNGGGVNIDPENPYKLVTSLQAIWKHYKAEMDRMARETENPDYGGEGEGETGDQEIAKLMKKLDFWIESESVDYGKDKIRYALIEASDKLFKPVTPEKD